jgi:hypothetical protein
MPESPNEPAQPKDAPAEPVAPETPLPAETPEPANAAADSATFSRCAACRNAGEVNSAAGTLVCKKHNMLINAEADEIPDDCVEYDPNDEGMRSVQDDPLPATEDLASDSSQESGGAE